MKFLLHLTASLKPRDLAVREVSPVQAIRGWLEQRGNARRNARHGALRKTLGVLLRDQVLALGGSELRAIDREKRLPFMNVFVSRIGKNLLDVTRKSRLNIGKPCFVDGDSSRRPDFVLPLLPFTRSN